EEFQGYDAPAASAEEVVEVTMTLRDEAGEERTIRLDGREHDALFWTASAIDKFAVPYYARTDGAEYAARMRRKVMAAPVCGLVHLPKSAWMTVGEEEFDGYGAPAESLRVETVTLTIREGDRTREVQLDGREHDAVFWSLSAIDKFAVPYYARTDGAEYAAEMRRKVAKGPVCGLAHMPKSEYVQLEPGGDEEFQGYDAPAASAGEVVEVTMTLRDEAGEERTIRLDGREHDALFWTASAIDKFAVPYYARTDDAEFAAEMRRRALAGPVCALGDMPWSEYTEIGGDEEFDGYGAPAGSLRVEAVTLTIREGDRMREVRLDGQKYDSVFWSLSAIDKFAVPYYARTDGAEFAARMRRRVLASPLHAIVHLPDTMYDMLDGAAARAAEPAAGPAPRLEAVAA
ncbi:MAG TPA: hypothetical protein VFR81_04680, partial [Longimicrobium sp.]|nr:hypothetical protein [Longimicrobium sp.]